jgi:hypothetical protein
LGRKMRVENYLNQIAGSCQTLGFQQIRVFA